MVDKTIAFINRQKSIHPEKPWIAYYAPNVRKLPVGVPDEFIERCRGEFDDGYDVLRDRILRGRRNLGSSRRRPRSHPGPRGVATVGRADRRGGWCSLDEVFCGAVEFTDHQMGPLASVQVPSRRATPRWPSLGRLRADGMLPK